MLRFILLSVLGIFPSLASAQQVVEQPSGDQIFIIKSAKCTRVEFDGKEVKSTGDLELLVYKNRRLQIQAFGSLVGVVRPSQIVFMRAKAQGGGYLLGLKDNQEILRVTHRRLKFTANGDVSCNYEVDEDIFDEFVTKHYGQ